MQMRGVVIALLLAWSLQVPARLVSGVEIPEQVTVDGEQLRLNGAGVREKFFIDVYAIGLYLGEQGLTVAEIESASVQKRILMRFVHSKVSKKKIDSGWWTGFKENSTPEQLAALKPRLERFQAMFGDMRAGDEVLLDLLPGRGTRVTINGADKGLIEGDDFSRALVRVWLGPHPVGGTLKSNLLGN